MWYELIVNWKNGISLPEDGILKAEFALSSRYVTFLLMTVSSF